MDIASLIGFLLAFGLIIGSMMMGSAPMSAFIDIKSAMVVVGGACAAAMMCFPLKSIIGTPGVMAIQSGENPRVIEQKLYTFLPAKQRPQEEAA